MKAQRNPFFTTVSGIEVDLVRPHPGDVEFNDVAHHLSLITRYGGACRRFYSVAEHLLNGMAGCTPELLPYWLLHDAHEYVSQDDTTPKKRALPLVMADALGGQFPLADIEKFTLAIETAFDQFELRHMGAVHFAAGLQFPVPPEIERAVKRIDRKMLLTEWQHIMPGAVPEQYRVLDGEPLEPFPIVTLAPISQELATRRLRGIFRACLPKFAEIRT